jgi:hypothetical protein
MVTAKQVAALKYLIFKAKNGTQTSKRILAFLIDQSDRFTQEVCCTLTEGLDGYSGEEVHEAALGVGSMQSCVRTTHIDEVLQVLGCEFEFSVHYGDFDPTRKGDPFNADGIFAGLPENLVTHPGKVREGLPCRYTFWLSREPYSGNANRIRVQRATLDQINLLKPGLYPTLEPT